MGELTDAAASMTAFAVEDEVTFTAGMAKPIFFAAAKSSITWTTRAKQCRFGNDEHVARKLVLGVVSHVLIYPGINRIVKSTRDRSIYTACEDEFGGKFRSHS